MEQNYNDPAYLEEMAKKCQAIPFVQLDTKTEWRFGDSLQCPFAEGIPELFGKNPMFYGAGAKVTDGHRFFAAKALSIDEDCFDFKKKPGFFAKKMPLKAKVVWFNRSSEIHMEMAGCFPGQHTDPKFRKPAVHFDLCTTLSLQVESWDTFAVQTALHGLYTVIDEAEPGAVVKTMEDLRQYLFDHLASSVSYGIGEGIFDLEKDAVKNEKGRYVIHIVTPEEWKAMGPTEQTRASLQLEFLFRQMDKQIKDFLGGKRSDDKHLISIAGWK